MLKEFAANRAVSVSVALQGEFIHEALLGLKAWAILYNRFAVKPIQISFSTGQ
jgi:hypothetical protein